MSKGYERKPNGNKQFISYMKEIRTGKTCKRSQRSKIIEEV